MPTDFAALSALRKFLHAIITFHFPVSASAFAVASPKPEDAPVIITFPFLRVFFAPGEEIAGVVAAVWALIGLICSLLLNPCDQRYIVISLNGGDASNFNKGTLLFCGLETQPAAICPMY